MKRARPSLPKVVSLAGGSRNLESKVRELARDSGNILWSHHIRDRMEERGFVVDDVLRILRNGYLKGLPEKTERNEWKVKMVLKLKGAREAGVVTIVFSDGRLFLKTVEWEDRR